jgi:hypothetical protein
MTISWWGGEDEADRAGEYRAYLESIEASLTPDVQQLTQISLHDANLVELLLNVRESKLELHLELPGESQRTASILYSGLVSFKSTGAPDEGLAGPGGYGDLGYDEVDLSGDGLFLHRILFSNGIEFEVTFRRVALTTPAV